MPPTIRIQLGNVEDTNIGRIQYFFFFQKIQHTNKHTRDTQVNINLYIM